MVLKKSRYLKDYILEEITINRSKEKKITRNFKIPCQSSYDDLKKYNYKIDQLKLICDHYSLKKKWK